MAPQSGRAGGSKLDLSEGRKPPFFGRLQALRLCKSGGQYCQRRRNRPNHRPRRWGL